MKLYIVKNNLLRRCNLNQLDNLYRFNQGYYICSSSCKIKIPSMLAETFGVKDSKVSAFEWTPIGPDTLVIQVEEDIINIEKSAPSIDLDLL